VVKKAPKIKREAKKWVTVVAPEFFGNKEICLISCSDESKIIGRTVTVSLFEVLGESEEQLNTEVEFRVIGVERGRAFTSFESLEVIREVLKSMIRKGTSMIDSHRNLTTKDGVFVRIFTIVYTGSRVGHSKKTAIRRIIFEILDKKASELNFDELIREVYAGKLSADIFNEIKRVCRLRYVGVRKIKVIRQLEGAQLPRLGAPS